MVVLGALGHHKTAAFCHPPGNHRGISFALTSENLAVLLFRVKVHGRMTLMSSAKLVKYRKGL